MGRFTNFSPEKQATYRNEDLPVCGDANGPPAVRRTSAADLLLLAAAEAWHRGRLFRQEPGVAQGGAVGGFCALRAFLS